MTLDFSCRFADLDVVIATPSSTQNPSSADLAVCSSNSEVLRLRHLPPSPGPPPVTSHRMPFRSIKPIVTVELDSMRDIDTGNAHNLFGLWSIFSKCAEHMEDGRRLENLSWRLWNRETLCCAPDHAPSPSPRRSPSPLVPQPQPTNASTHDLPELSSSPSATPPDTLPTPYPTDLASRAHLLLQRPTRSRNSRKHISPVALQNIVTSIKKDGEKGTPELPPLPPRLVSVPDVAARTVQSRRVEDSTPTPSSPPRETQHEEPQSRPRIVPESSTSTVSTTLLGDLSGMSPHAASEASTASTELSTTNIVRGFEPGRMSSSLRSKTHLSGCASASGPTSSLRTTTSFAQSQLKAQQKPKGKGATFQLGGSSGSDEENSFKHFGGHSSLSDGLRKSGVKQASFQDEVKIRTYRQSQALESDSEDEDRSSSAIEDDDLEDGDWEDADDDPSTHPSFKDEHMFQRVDSRANLRSRPSLLTAMMHETDRAAALQNAASRSTPAIRRSRTSSPNGPSFPTPTHTDTAATDAHPVEITRSKPIIMTTSNTHQPALSPRTTRRNMLSSELTESLRKNLLWERQQKNSTTNAALKRRHTANDMRNLRHYPGESAPVVPSALGVIKEGPSNHAVNGTIKPASNGTGKPAVNGNGKAISSWTNNQTDFFTSGPDDLHQRGW